MFFHLTSLFLVNQLFSPKAEFSCISSGLLYICVAATSLVIRPLFPKLVAWSLKIFIIFFVRTFETAFQNIIFLVCIFFSFILFLYDRLVYDQLIWRILLVFSVSTRWLHWLLFNLKEFLKFLSWILFVLHGLFWLYKHQFFSPRRISQNLDKISSFSTMNFRSFSETNFLLIPAPVKFSYFFPHELCVHPVTLYLRNYSDHSRFSRLTHAGDDFLNLNFTFLRWDFVDLVDYLAIPRGSP